MSKAFDTFLPGRPPRRRHAFGLLVLGLLVPALTFFPRVDISAQQPAGILSGTVTTLEGSAVAGAQILVAGRDTGVLSAQDGRFAVSGVLLGERIVEVRRIGYRTAARTLVFVAGQPTRWDVALEVVPVLMDSLEVSGTRGRTPPLEGFYARRDRGTGAFFTRREIEAMNAREVTDVLRRVPGARVVPFPGPFGTVNVLQLSRSQGTTASACAIFYFMNGVPFPVRADIGIDAFVRAQDVEAVEVYSGGSRIPPEFSSGAQGSRCGVVAVWTRSGGDAPRWRDR